MKKHRKIIKPIIIIFAVLAILVALIAFSRMYFLAREAALNPTSPELNTDFEVAKSRGPAVQLSDKWSEEVIVTNLTEYRKSSFITNLSSSTKELMSEINAKEKAAISEFAASSGARSDYLVELFDSKGSSVSSLLLQQILKDNPDINKTVTTSLRPSSVGVESVKAAGTVADNFSFDGAGWTDITKNVFIDYYPKLEAKIGLRNIVDRTTNTSIHLQLAADNYSYYAQATNTIFVGNTAAGIDFVLIHEMAHSFVGLGNEAMPYLWAEGLAELATWLVLDGPIGASPVNVLANDNAATGIGQDFQSYRTVKGLIEMENFNLGFRGEYDSYSWASAAALKFYFEYDKGNMSMGGNMLKAIYNTLYNQITNTSGAVPTFLKQGRIEDDQFYKIISGLIPSVEGVPIGQWFSVHYFNSTWAGDAGAAYVQPKNGYSVLGNNDALVVYPAKIKNSIADFSINIKAYNFDGKLLGSQNINSCANCSIVKWLSDPNDPTTTSYEGIILPEINLIQNISLPAWQSYEGIVKIVINDKYIQYLSKINLPAASIVNSNAIYGTIIGGQDGDTVEFGSLAKSTVKNGITKILLSGNIAFGESAVVVKGDRLACDQPDCQKVNKVLASTTYILPGLKNYTFSIKAEPCSCCVDFNGLAVKNKDTCTLCSSSVVMNGIPTFYGFGDYSLENYFYYNSFGPLTNQKPISLLTDILGPDLTNIKSQLLPSDSQGYDGSTLKETVLSFTPRMNLPKIDLNVDEAFISENGGQVAIQAVLDIPSTTAVTVKLKNTGTASTSDFDGWFTDLVIPAGQLESNIITLTSKDNGQTTGDENLMLGFDSVLGADYDPNTWVDVMILEQPLNGGGIASNGANIDDTLDYTMVPDATLNSTETNLATMGGIQTFFGGAFDWLVNAYYDIMDYVAPGLTSQPLGDQGVLKKTWSGADLVKFDQNGTVFDPTDNTITLQSGVASGVVTRIYDSHIPQAEWKDFENKITTANGADWTTVISASDDLVELQNFTAFADGRVKTADTSNPLAIDAALAATPAKVESSKPITTTKATIYRVDKLYPSNKEHPKGRLIKVETQLNAKTYNGKLRMGEITVDFGIGKAVCPTDGRTLVSKQYKSSAAVEACLGSGYQYISESGQYVEFTFFGKKIDTSRYMVIPILKAEAFYHKKKLTHTIKEVSGVALRGNSSQTNKPSAHTWGLAVDINATDLKRGIHAGTKVPNDFIQIMQDSGFYWGEHFKTPDPHHWQLLGNWG